MVEIIHCPDPPSRKDLLLPTPCAGAMLPALGQPFQVCLSCRAASSKVTSFSRQPTSHEWLRWGCKGTGQGQGGQLWQMLYVGELPWDWPNLPWGCIIAWLAPLPLLLLPSSFHRVPPKGIPTEYSVPETPCHNHQPAPAFQIKMTIFLCGKNI